MHFSHGEEAVSYTHLDVYKRQVLLVIVYNLAGKLKGISVKNLNIKDIERLEKEEASQNA